MKHQVVLSIAREIDVPVKDLSDDEEVRAAVDKAVGVHVKKLEEAGWQVTIDSIVDNSDEEDEDYLDDDEDDEEE